MVKVKNSFWDQFPKIVSAGPVMEFRTDHIWPYIGGLESDTLPWWPDRRVDVGYYNRLWCWSCLVAASDVFFNKQKTKFISKNNTPSL